MLAFAARAAAGTSDVRTIPEHKTAGKALWRLNTECLFHALADVLEMAEHLFFRHVERLRQFARCPVALGKKFNNVFPYGHNLLMS